MKSTKQLLSEESRDSKKTSHLIKQQEKIHKVTEKIIDKLRDEEYAEKRKIEDKFSKQRNTITDKQESQDNEYEKQYTELHESLFSLKKVIYFLKNAQKEDRFDAGKIKNYERYGISDKVHRLYAYSDEFLNLSYIAYDVDRPKNKVALVILGSCKIGGRSDDFGAQILQVPYSYGCHLRHEGGANFLQEVKYLPDMESAKKYAQENPIEKVLKVFLKKYELVKEECQIVLENYDLADFEKYRLEQARKYFEDHNQNSLDYYLEQLKIRKTTWEKLSQKSKLLVMEKWS